MRDMHDDVTTNSLPNIQPTFRELHCTPTAKQSPKMGHLSEAGPFGSVAGHWQIASALDVVCPRGVAVARLAASALC